MAKADRLIYACTACGAQHSKWAGQCGDCGEWNSLQEVRPTLAGNAAVKRPTGYAGESSITKLVDVDLVDNERSSTGVTELDRVLGGGLVTGSVVLIGGDPGIGKSTLLIQAMAALTARMPSLYITGEESLQQVAMRAKRLGLPIDDLQVLAETCVERIIDLCRIAKPKVLVIDSIQTVFSEAVSSAPGTVSQVRESAAQLVRFAKQSGTALFLVGHVTKEGTLAGPRVLEHMVDTVLYFESEAGSRYRAIRAVKNRFGAVNELGVFAMTEEGLKQVSNPSAIFLSRHSEPVPGSVVMVTREGSRPLLVEVQALVDESHSGHPRRVAVGLDQNRLTLLLAVLHKHTGVAMHDQDVFVNVVGGVRVSETASDLPLLMAALSSLRERPLPGDLIAFGEVGLAGEVRPVQAGEDRLSEAVKHGFTRAIVPTANNPRKPIKGLTVIAIDRLDQLPDAMSEIS